MMNLVLRGAVGRMHSVVWWGGGVIPFYIDLGIRTVVA